MCLCLLHTDKHPTANTAVPASGHGRIVADRSQHPHNKVLQHEDGIGKEGIVKLQTFLFWVYVETIRVACCITH